MAGEEGVYAVIYEGKTQGPILMETEAQDSSYEAACARREKLRACPDTIRVCVVKVAPVERYCDGNSALLPMMKVMQV